MIKAVGGLLLAMAFALSMLLLSPQPANAQLLCGTGWCAQERQGCIELCGRCVAWFSCTFGSTCN